MAALGLSDDLAHIHADERRRRVGHLAERVERRLPSPGVRLRVKEPEGMLDEVARVEGSRPISARVIGRVKIKPGREDETLAMIGERGVAMLEGMAGSTDAVRARSVEFARGRVLCRLARRLEAVEAAATGQHRHPASRLRAVHRVAAGQRRVPGRSGILDARHPSQRCLVGLEHLGPERTHAGIDRVAFRAVPVQCCADESSTTEAAPTATADLPRVLHTT